MDHDIQKFGDFGLEGQFFFAHSIFSLLSLSYLVFRTRPGHAGSYWVEIHIRQEYVGRTLKKIHLSNKLIYRIVAVAGSLKDIDFGDLSCRDASYSP